MATRSNQSFDLGEHWPMLLTCHDDAAGAQVMDLTGAQLVLRMRQPSGDLVIDLNSGISIVDPPTSGQAMILVAPAQQVGISPGSYPYTVRVTKADGAVSDQVFGLITVRATEFPST